MSQDFHGTVKAAAAGRVGQVKEVTSLSNPVVKDLRALSQKKHRDRSGLFLAEGQKLVIDALALGWRIRTLLCSRAAREKKDVAAVAARTVAEGGLVLEASEKVVRAIARRDNPQQLMGVFEQRFLALDKLAVAPGETVVALDRVRDPGNLGTIIRTADSAGAKAVILIGETTDPFSLETVRATMGSIFAIPVVQASQEAFLAWHRQDQVFVIGTHMAGSLDYRTIPYRDKPAVLLMGNEQAGLSDLLADNCDCLVRIPQSGRADSLNLAVATGLMLFEARREMLRLEEMTRNPLVR